MITGYAVVQAHAIGRSGEKWVVVRDGAPLRPEDEAPGELLSIADELNREAVAAPVDAGIIARATTNNTICVGADTNADEWTPVGEWPSAWCIARGLSVGGVPTAYSVEGADWDGRVSQLALALHRLNGTQPSPKPPPKPTAEELNRRKRKDAEIERRMAIANRKESALLSLAAALHVTTAEAYEAFKAIGELMAL